MDYLLGYHVCLLDLGDIPLGERIITMTDREPSIAEKWAQEITTKNLSLGYEPDYVVDEESAIEAIQSAIDEAQAKDKERIAELTEDIGNYEFVYNITPYDLKGVKDERIEELKGGLGKIVDGQPIAVGDKLYKTGINHGYSIAKRIAANTLKGE